MSTPTAYGVHAWGTAPWGGIPDQRTQARAEVELINTLWTGALEGTIAERDLFAPLWCGDLIDAVPDTDLTGSGPDYDLIGTRRETALRRVRR